MALIGTIFVIVKSSWTLVWSSNNHSPDGDICNLQPVNWDNNGPILLWQGARRDWRGPLHRGSLLHPRPGEGRRQLGRNASEPQLSVLTKPHVAAKQLEQPAAVRVGSLGQVWRHQVRHCVHFMCISVLQVEVFPYLPYCCSVHRVFIDVCKSERCWIKILTIQNVFDGWLTKNLLQKM